MIVLSYKLDADYLVEMLARHRATLGARWLMLAVKIFCVILLVTLTTFIFYEGPWLLGVFFVLITVSLLFSRQIGYWQFRRSLKKSPFYNEVVAAELSDEGFHSKTSNADSRLFWSVYSKAAHFKDGFLLFQGPGLATWIPFSALTDASKKQELENLLRAKIQIHQVVEKVQY